MTRFRKLFTLVALLAGAAILGAPSQAQADFKLYLQQDGGVITEVASGANFTSIQYGFPLEAIFGDFAVKVFSGSSDNGAALSDLLSSTNKITNLDSKFHTLSLYVSQTDYTLPLGSQLRVESGMGGSVNTGILTPGGIFQAYADKNNNLLGMGDFTNGPQNDNQLGSTFDTGSATGTFTRTGNYSLTSVSTITLSGGGQVNYSNHVNVTPTPAPAGVLLALSGLPCLGIGAWLRRRQVQLQNS